MRLVLGPPLAVGGYIALLSTTGTRGVHLDETLSAIVMVVGLILMFSWLLDRWAPRA